MSGARSLADFPLHLGLGATIVSEPEFTGPDWYQAYSERHAADGAEGRLVSHFRFDESWTSWEMHPNGDEAVIVVSGRMILHQEFPDGRAQSVELGPGEYAINPRGSWHTADTDGLVVAMFVTAGEGTCHRPRC